MPLLQSLLLSCALLFELAHGIGYRERPLIVLSSEFDADNIHAMATTHRHKRRANWDPDFQSSELNLVKTTLGSYKLAHPL